MCECVLLNKMSVTNLILTVGEGFSSLRHRKSPSIQHHGAMPSVLNQLSTTKLLNSSLQQHFNTTIYQVNVVRSRVESPGTCSPDMVTVHPQAPLALSNYNSASLSCHTEHKSKYKNGPIAPSSWVCACCLATT